VKLSVQQNQGLYDAIVAAFANRNELKRTLGLRLGVKLDSISGGTGLEDATYDLLEWAEREERMEELVSALSAAKPRNRYFSDLAAQLASSPTNSPVPIQVTPPPIQDTTPPPVVDLNNLTPQLRRQLYLALLDAFPTPGDLERMLKFGLDTHLATITTASGLKNQVLDVITSVCARGQLEQFVRGALEDNPGSPPLRRFAQDVGIVPPPTA
jgi:hypothetical protein